MKTCELVLCLPRDLGSQFSPVVVNPNSSLIDKLEQAYFSKGFM